MSGEGRISIDPEHYMTFCVIPKKMNMAWFLCERWVERGLGDKTAICYEDERITWGELDAYASRFANALKALKIHRGDRYMVRTHNSPEFVASVVGGWKIGAVPVLVNILFKGKELEHVANSTQARAIFCDPRYIAPVMETREKCAPVKHVISYGELGSCDGTYQELIEAAPGDAVRSVNTGSEDEAFITFTSGSTGLPKGVCHAHRAVTGIHAIAKNCLRLTPADIVYGTMQMGFIYGFLVAYCDAAYSGASLVLDPERFDPERVFRNIERYGVTVFMCVPSGFKMLLGVKDAEKRYNLRHLRFCHSAGEVLSKAVYDEWKERFGLDIADLLGQTECNEILGYWPEIDKGLKPGSIGKPVPLYGRVVAVVDENGEVCAPGRVGHLVLKDDDSALFSKYVGAPGAWERCHKRGWYYLGDMAYVDEDGYFWYVSRADDLIKSRGYSISPKEVEDVVQELPEVLNTCVIGAEEPGGGQRVKAFVALRGGHQPSSPLAKRILDHCRSRMASYKCPKVIEFIEEIPTTLTGKVSRRAVRAIEEERKGASGREGSLFVLE